jgi:hypothetical protein
MQTPPSMQVCLASSPQFFWLTIIIGAKTYYHQYPGFPHVRVELVVKFANANGFMLVGRALYEPEVRWLGTTSLANIYRTLCLDEVSFYAFTGCIHGLSDE